MKHKLFVIFGISEKLSFVYMMLIALSICVALPNCSGDDDDDIDAGDIKEGESEKWLFVVTTDYQSGSFSLINTETLEAQPSIDTIYMDASATFYEKYVYIINRYGQDNIEIRDPNDGFKVIKQYSTGSASNPHGLCFANDEKAYVTLYEKDYILVVNPLTGEELGRIDISSHADADGIPEMSACKIIGDTLFVGLQLLDRNDTMFPPTGESYILAVNTSSDKVEKSIKCSSTNPLSVFRKTDADEKLWIGYSGMMPGGDDAGIEYLDTDTFEMSGLIIDEKKAGGDIQNFAMIDDNTGFVVVSDENFNMKLYKFDASSGKKEEIFSTEGYNIGGIALSKDGKLFVADRTINAPGIRVFKADTGKEITDSVIDVGPPPVSEFLYP